MVLVGWRNQSRLLRLTCGSFLCPFLISNFPDEQAQSRLVCVRGQGGRAKRFHDGDTEIHDECVALVADFNRSTCRS
ncbi:uncharacterized protein LACBIDRAFT_316194 [Laccaria bicolor S238N-H82]|uniref:Predicted protein n=1 Tax=Laccaria bicolor (strain S238N-H82 / ATCC MYA-4686) TaxID=486041 RepID=B0E0E4_LACBS|nr:uncharacterized protein LACBIDRAFT_316194 [Laccaria bicolor S238N-H82]EDQ99705.1 predicted protein [Laccaria bicolor S238N-H82]|eukprot:XP_001889682.1 predicted protein [Laccaria bicolor S238N-H82]